MELHKQQIDYTRVDQIISETAYRISNVNGWDLNCVESEDIVNYLSDEDKSELILILTAKSDIYELFEFLDADMQQRFILQILSPTNKFSQISVMEMARKKILNSCDSWLALMIDPVVDRNKVWGW